MVSHQALNIAFISINLCYVYYFIAGVSSKDSERAPVMLQSLEEIEIAFAKMTTRIKEVLHKNKVSVDKLIEQLCAISAVRYKNVPIFDEDISEKVESVDELWKKLRSFWNIFDYDILILVIRFADCSEAAEIFDDFLAKIDLSVLDDGIVLYHEEYKGESKRPVLRVKVKAEKFTIDIKNKVKDIISKKFELSEYSLRLKCIKEGCVEFIYDISKAVVSYLLEFKVTSAIGTDFLSQNIISLWINDDPIMKPSMPITESDQVIVICSVKLHLCIKYGIV